MLEVRSFGGFALRTGDRTIPPPATQKGRALLLYLIANKDTKHGRERLLELFWPESEPEKARQNFNTALWAIRKNLREAQLDPDAYIAADKLAVQWIGPVLYDAHEFEHHAASSDEREVQIALDLYTGDFLEGDFEEWTVSQRERLSGLYERLVEHRVAASGDVEAAKALLLRNPFSEKAYDVLIDDARKGGRLQLARSLYSRARAALEELGTQPSVDFESRYGALASQRVPAKNPFPAYATSFLGRDKEIGELCELLESEQILSICGAGGIGKTRLAVEVAKSEYGLFADGVFFVQLAALSDGAFVPDAIGSATGVAPGDNVLPRLIDEFTGKQVLIVLDNCEHLIDACAALVEEFCQKTGSGRVLATSRQPLDVSGEHVYRLEPLQSSSACALFAERARARNSSFSVSEHDMTALVALAQRLDGIPLAIELAAARSNVLSISELLARIDRRFELLKSNVRGGLARHQTLRATIDWSFQTLTVEQRREFSRLAVMAGDFGVEAAAALLARNDEDTIDLLEQFVDKSLLAVKTSDAKRRFYLLDSLRDYALEVLRDAGDEDRTRQLHAQYFTQFAEKVAEQYRVVDGSQWVALFTAELENLRQAIAFLSGGTRPDLLGRIALATNAFWLESGRAAEGRNAMDIALGVEGALEGSDRLLIVRGRSNSARSSGLYAEAEKFALEAMRYCEAKQLPDADRAHAMMCLASALFFAGKPQDVEKLYQGALEIHLREGNHAHAATVIYNHGNFLMEYAGDFEGAKERFLESLRLDNDANDLFGQALVQEALARAEFLAGDFRAASGHLEASCRLYESLQNKERLVSAQCGLVQHLSMSGEVGRARALFDELRPELLGALSPGGETDALDAAVSLAYAERRLEDSARLFGLIEEHDRQFSVARFPMEKVRYDPIRADVRTRMGDEAFAAAYDEGKNLHFHEALLLRSSISASI